MSSTPYPCCPLFASASQPSTTTAAAAAAALTWRWEDSPKILNLAEVDQPAMHPFVVITLTVLWYIAYPFWKLFHWLYYLLKPLRYLLYILSVPFVHIVHFFGKALSWPVGFLAKLEVRTLKDRAIDNGTETSWFQDLYIYLSCALFVGAVTGLCLHSVYLILLRISGLTPSPSINHPNSRRVTTLSTKQQGRSVAEYRADRRRRKERQDSF